ncbi:MAG: hydantoinase/oxoprolinase family protein, partial [Candidatus Cybelea sp.]
AAQRAFELVAQALGAEPLSLARAVLAAAATKLRLGIERLIADYSLDRESVAIVGGGGGAGALIPAVAELAQLPYRIARDAEVIAPIGVALALVRDSVERTIVAPSPQEIARIRREAADRVVAAGAAPDRVEVEIEIDTQRNRVRATASGATALVDSAALPTCSEDERRAAAAESMRCEPSQLAAFELTRPLTAYKRCRPAVSALRRVREICDVRVVDERGVVRLALQDPAVTLATAGEIAARVREAIENATNFGDVGRALPALYLLRGGRIAAFEGLSSAEQGAALAEEETDGCPAGEGVALLVVPREA